jgi:hypothetical protein
LLKGKAEFYEILAAFWPKRYEKRPSQTCPALEAYDTYKSIFDLEFEHPPHTSFLEFLTLAAEGKAVGGFLVFKILAAE